MKRQKRKQRSAKLKSSVWHKAICADEHSVNEMKLSDATDITDNSNEDIREKLEIVMPPKMSKRGWPKGAETTVIGLPKKKQSCSKKPLPFSRLGPKEKDRIILE